MLSFWAWAARLVAPGTRTAPYPSGHAMQVAAEKFRLSAIVEWLLTGSIFVLKLGETQ
ncbi:MAG: hypothetical protein JSW48_06255 [Betaproteobacteria bacterium]|jgi:hypothetical protein|nr:MAG: hypothetical protein JSW48_06255 [Betaproteobacteria bacterium]